MHRKITSAAIAVTTVLSLSAAAHADFMDDYTVPDTLADNYSYFFFNGFASGDSVNSFSNAGGSFSLDTGAGQVNLTTIATGGFTFNRLARQGANLDLSGAGASATVNLSSWDNNFGSGRVVNLGFEGGTASGTLEARMTNENGSVSYDVGFTPNGGSFSSIAMGNFDPGFFLNPNGQDVTLSVDSDSLSLSIGASPVLTDVTHGIDLSTTVAANPYYEGRILFGNKTFELLVNSFEGNAIPEPATFSLVGLAGLGLMRRRK